MTLAFFVRRLLEHDLLFTGAEVAALRALAGRAPNKSLRPESFYVLCEDVLRRLISDAQRSHDS